MPTQKRRKSEFPPPINKRQVALYAGGLVAAATVLVVLQLWAGLRIPFVTPTAPAPSYLAKYEATVTIGPNGFEPSTLTVKPATRIFFENQDSANHKVDPGDSPDPTFGSPSEILPQTGYVFVFQNHGVYKFHDADNPAANGEVDVQ